MLVINMVDISNASENIDKDDDDMHNSDFPKTFKRLREVELTEDEIDFES